MEGSRTEHIPGLTRDGRRSAWVGGGGGGGGSGILCGAEPDKRTGSCRSVSDRRQHDDDALARNLGSIAVTELGSWRSEASAVSPSTGKPFVQSASSEDCRHFRAAEVS